MEMLMKMWACLLCLVVVGLKVCGGTRQLRDKEDSFIAHENSILIMVMKSAGSSTPELRDLVGNTIVGSEVEETRAPANIATIDDSLTFRFKKGRTGIDANKGYPGLSHMQRLSESKPSPGVGHMQIFRGHNKRALESTPSPGGGH